MQRFCLNHGYNLMKQILIVLSEWGFWGEELIGPMETFEKGEYKLVFCTPHGRRPRALPPSMDPTFIDPPLGKKVVSETMAAKVKAVDDLSNRLLNVPVNLADWFPERPYWSQDETINGETVVLRKWENYYRQRESAQNETDAYRCAPAGGGERPDD